MGQAKRRPNRVQEAIVAIAWDEALKIHKALKLHEQEILGWRMMSDEEKELSIERYDRAAKRKHKGDMAMAQLFGMLYGGFGHGMFLR